ncbi:MAG TPA: diaminopimelate epimerase [Casimicrobiaceae bacterium]|nr:diaminopimelate epimerase [Casimicrobiaceae bacterium]
MHGAGNDFVVVDAMREAFALTRSQVRKLADRRFGVGCDQVLVVEPPDDGDVDFGYRIFNADGGEVEQCGNGARCFLVYVRAKGLTAKRDVRVKTPGGVIVLAMADDGEVTVDMGKPSFEAATVPFIGGSSGSRDDLAVGDRTLDVSVLSMGNPHVVQMVDDVEAAPVTTQGAAIATHPRFPAQANAGYAQIVDRANIRLRVYERGVGETLACGTGACAAVVAGIRRGLLDREVRVHMRGGGLTVRWDGAGSIVSMKGPAEIVFEGEWPIPDA